MRGLSDDARGIIADILPLALIGWMIIHLIGSAGRSIVGLALMPTMICLGFVALFFAARLAARLLRAARSHDPATPTPSASAHSVETQSFDPDAALANYMRKRGQGPAATVAADDDADMPRPFNDSSGFGRKGG